MSNRKPIKKTFRGNIQWLFCSFHQLCSVQRLQNEVETFKTKRGSVFCFHNVLWTHDRLLVIKRTFNRFLRDDKNPFEVFSCLLIGIKIGLQSFQQLFHLLTLQFGHKVLCLCILLQPCNSIHNRFGSFLSNEQISGDYNFSTAKTSLFTDLKFP